MKRQFFSGLAGVSFVAIAIASPSISIAACAYSPSASGDAGLVYSADGQLHMFHSAYGSGNLIHAYGNPSNPGVFSLTLENLGGVAASTKPAVVSWGAGHVAAFVRRGDSGIYYYQIDNGVHSGWQALGGVKTYNPSAISLAPGHMIVFARGSVTTQGIWYREFNNGAWGGWVQLGGWVTNSPSAVSWGAGHVAVFYRGNEGKIWYAQRFGNGGWSHSSFNQFGNFDYSVISRGTGLMDVLYLGNNGNTWHGRFNGASWTGTTLGSPFGGSLREPAIVATNSGELVAFVRGLILDGHNGNPDIGGLYKRSSWDGGWTWSSYELRGAAEYNNPEALALPTGGWVTAVQDGNRTMQLCTGG